MISTSIIVPTLNEEKLLGCMLAQFSPAVKERYGLEVIVSDGGSSDRTLEIARGGADVVVENAPCVRQTIAMGRNAGAVLARGSLLIFLNADTLIADVDAFFQAIERHITVPGTVALTCSVMVFPQERRLSDRLFHGFYNWFFSTMNKVGMAMGRGECHIIKKQIFDELHGYGTQIAAGEDYDMFRRLETKGRVKFIREIVVYESPRRYRKFGYAYVTASWFLNFLSVFFLRRSISGEWKAVR